MIFVILSNQQFDSKLKTNKWQVAKQLAKKGHNVIFVDPPLRFKAIRNFTKLVDHKNRNLIVYKPVNLLNFKPFSRMNIFVHLKIINHLVRKLDDKSGRKVLYIYHFDFPDLRDFMGIFKYDVAVYDCVDIYSEFPEYSEGKKVNPTLISFIQRIDDALKVKFNQNGLKLKAWVDNQEEWLCKNADLVFASAPGIIARLKKWRSQIEYLPNAVDFEKFDHKIKDPEPEDLKAIPHPRIGFSGAIDSYKNDISLIEKCAETYPNYHFVMIGPEKVSDPKLNLSLLKSLRNVHFLGEKPWEITPSYFDHFDAYFIPYNLNDYTIGCHPIKYFEGLAAGLPTLITLSSVKAFDPDNYVTEDKTQFVKNVELAITMDNEQKRAARKELARQHTWNNKVNRQIELIIKVLEKTK